MNNFLFVVAFSLAKSISQKFQEFMEKTHYRTLYKTGCFEGKVDKLFTPGKDTDSLVYILYPKDKDNWEKYKKDFRPETMKEFMDEYESALNSGDVKIIKVDGYVQSFLISE